MALSQPRSSMSDAMSSDCNERTPFYLLYE
jgi:hypothetical protein